MADNARVLITTRSGLVAAALLLGLAGCREPDGPLGGDDAGILVVRSDPPGGAIRLDDRATGRFTPDTLRGIAGLHDVTVELDTVQLRYRYAAQVVVPTTGGPLVLNGPLMARCQGTTGDCAAPFRIQHQLGTVRFASNALGPFFLQSGNGQGLYWPASTDNSYVSTATPVFAGQTDGNAVSTGVYDTDFLAGRPAPSSRTSGGQLTLTQTTWILPPLQAQQFAVARGLEVRERLLTTTSAEAVFLVELTFRNISRDSLYGIVDPAMVQLGGVTFQDAYIGLALDPDIGTSDNEADDDWVSYDAAEATVYAYDANFVVPGFTVNENGPGMVGLRVLQRPAGSGVVLNAWTRQTAADWQGGTTTQAAGYGMLSGLQSYNPDHAGTVVGHLPVSAGDVRIVATVGPLQLAPGDSARVVLAVALALPTPGTYTSGTSLPPGNPDDTNRQMYRVAGQLRDRLTAASSLLPLLN